MNPRITLFFVLVLAGLGLVVFGLKGQGGGAGDIPTPVPRPTVLALESTKVNKMTVEKGGKTTVVQKSPDGSKWVLEPGDEPADDARIRSLVSRLSNLQGTSQVNDAGSDMSVYGLDKPTVKVTIESEGLSPSVLIVGGATPIGTGYYVKVDGSDGIYVVPTILGDDLKRTVDSPPLPVATPTPRPALQATPAPQPPTPTPLGSPQEGG